MSNRVNCQNCGAGIDLPSGFDRAKIRCPGCGYYAEVPTALRSAADEPEDEFRFEDDSPPSSRRPEPSPQVSPPPTPGKRRAPDGYDVDAEESYSFADPLPPPPPPPPPPKRKAPREARRARPQLDPRDHRASFEPEEGRGQPLLQGSQEEDDDRPYAVPGTGLQTCPNCKGELPLESALCVHCGRDLTTGDKAPRVYQPIEGSWEEGWPLHVRISVFAGMQVLNLVLLILLIVSDGSYSFGSFVTNGFFMTLNSVLQAFLLGSFDQISLKRTARGQTTITRTRRIVFYKLPPEKIPWKDSAGVGIVGTHDPGMFTWLMCLYLALFCLLPGIIFYFVVIRPDRFQVNVVDVYGGTDAVAFHSRNRDQAEEIAKLISEATGLTYRRVL